jgi:hypothetical protein
MLRKKKAARKREVWRKVIGEAMAQERFKASYKNKNKNKK